MTLGDAIAVLEANGLRPEVSGPDGAVDLDRALTGIAYDSRRVDPGALFVGMAGARADGASFAGDAVARGACAIVAERGPVPGLSAAWIRVGDGRLALALLAAAFYRHPSRDLRVVGITGTNGKTTTSYLVRAILEQAGAPCGLVGTVHYSVGGELIDAPRTTPESVDLQALFRRMVDAGAGGCAMEVSSHALSLRRVDGTRFAAAVFTNLTRDHLDFHGTMSDYFDAKARLFGMLPPGAPAVLNADDDYGRRLATTCATTITYGVASAAADVRPEHVVSSLAGLSFDAVTPSGRVAIRSPLTGTFNLYNLLAAVATGIGLGLDSSTIADGLARMSAVPGRLQVVSGAADDITVIVDYAHTDDALHNVLEAVRPLVSGRLVTVFGCGGDRDRTKRPLMGAIAARLSDAVVLTSDNPRSEDPAAILDEIAAGIPASAAGAWTRDPDRRRAIVSVIEAARPDDVVVIAGKGHERYQIIGSTTLPFDDAAVAVGALTARRAARMRSGA